MQVDSPYAIFSTARGDHMITAAVFFSLAYSLCMWVCFFEDSLAGFVFFLFASFLGLYIPLVIVSEFFPHWIDNQLEPGHFWRDLLCR